MLVVTTNDLAGHQIVKTHGVARGITAVLTYGTAVIVIPL